MGGGSPERGTTPTPFTGPPRQSPHRRFTATAALIPSFLRKAAKGALEPPGSAGASSSVRLMLHQASQPAPEHISRERHRG